MATSPPHMEVANVMETTDPFILALRKNPPPTPEVKVTRIAVIPSVWEEFKARCHAHESCSPSEMLHHLMTEYLRRKL